MLRRVRLDEENLDTYRRHSLQDPVPTQPQRRDNTTVPSARSDADEDTDNWRFRRSARHFRAEHSRFQWRTHEIPL